MEVETNRCGHEIYYLGYGMRTVIIFQPQRPLWNPYGFVPPVDMNNEPMPIPMNIDGMNPNMNPMMMNQMNQMMMSQMMGANGMMCNTFIEILNKTVILCRLWSRPVSSPRHDDAADGPSSPQPAATSPTTSGSGGRKVKVIENKLEGKRY